MFDLIHHFPQRLATSAIVASVIFGCAVVNGGEALFPNADFEAGNRDGWKQDGDAFQFQPTRGDNPRARGRESSGHEGEYWVGGFEKFDGRTGKPGDIFHDDATGTLTSPEFTIRKRFLTFLIGGGYLPGKAGVKLVCDGKEIVLATGADSETMVPSSHDVSAYLGKQARLVVFDQATGDWGHINVDSFASSDEPRPLPNGEFAFLEGIPSKACPDASYDQPLRPQFHFSACANWLNDPNGLVYDGEQYHLFFQHNPLSPAWGNMTWGHAVSPDMVHWRQVDHALLPYRVDGRQGTVFSGTCVVDHNNSLGVQRGDRKTLCAFFTFAAPPRFYQSMAYSTDGGVTWKYWNEGRPVVPNQGFDREERDPKVFWHEASKQWVMALWVQQNPGRVRFFTSQNLVDWTFASDLMRDWAFECMDVIFLPLDGDKQNPKAVIYDASFDYEVGTFDGKEFHTEAGPLRAGGGNFYAAQTFNNRPDGRTVQIGWMRGGPNTAVAYGLPYNQQMAFPCELTLRTTPGGVRLFARPIAELDSLVTETITRRDVVLSKGADLLRDVPPLDLVDVEVEFSPGTAQQVIFDFAGATLTYDAAARTLTQTGVDNEGRAMDVTVFDDLAPRDGRIKLRLLIDRLSIDSYAFDGERYSCNYYSPKLGDGKQSIYAVGGDATIKRANIRVLRSAWEPR